MSALSNVSRARLTALALLYLIAALGLSGCAGFGSARLQHDQVDYARALSEAQKRQILGNMLALRYGDAPSTLPVTQVIAAYSFEGSANASVSGSDAADAVTTGSTGVTLGYANEPTFTFTPVTGEDYATAYVRPLSPPLVLPLIQSGVPVDVLLRLIAQSVGSLRNSAALAGLNSAGDPEFFELLHALRRLQMRSSLELRIESSSSNDAARVLLGINPARLSEPEVAQDAGLIQRLLNLPEGSHEVEIVYGQGTASGARLGMVTRSVTGMLMELGAQVDVPQADVDRGATLPTVRLVTVEKRAAIVVHHGTSPPPDAYASDRRGKTWYWVAGDDFDSKFAFSILQTLIALAQAGKPLAAPVVTIPAN